LFDQRAESGAIRVYSLVGEPVCLSPDQMIR